MRPSDKRLREAACWGGSALPLNPEREGDGVSRGFDDVDDMIAAERVRADRAEAERDALAAALRKTTYYACRVCGFSEQNRANWCDLGCGRDYNEMKRVEHPVLAAVSTPEEER